MRRRQSVSNGPWLWRRRWPRPTTILAGSARNRGRLDEAIAAFRRALALQPDHAGIHCNLGAALLARGDYAEGWREHEWRLHPDVARTPAPPQPLWNGEDPAGRTILLRSEQGLGDVLQFIRYAAPLAQMGAKIVAEVPAPLARLLKTVPGVAQVVAVGRSLAALRLPSVDDERALPAGNDVSDNSGDHPLSDPGPGSDRALGRTPGRIVRPKNWPGLGRSRPPR